MAYPPGNHQQEANHAPSSFNGVHLNNGKPIPESWCPGLKHNPGISMDWTLEEQVILENGLQKYALESSVTRYAKIALDLQNKTVRDVALRCKWMTKKENSKRRKEGLNLARKIKDKRERVYPSGNHTHFAAQPNLPPYPTPMIPVDFNDGISYTAIGGVTGELLEQNAQALNRISENIAALQPWWILTELVSFTLFQLQENIGLFRQTRENILKIINVLNDTPDAMRQMPQLRERIKDKMFNYLLSPPPHPMQL
ncbi:Killer toxin KHS [Gossypium arboreum]|uniref:Killer toxin KHS n=1 Tax=Gossypium arboreum TaxID=29729 RepID=A0A0B0ND76_GOSAR|nr:Killer toxin KHS [Gossypium arboreum]